MGRSPALGAPRSVGPTRNRSCRAARGRQNHARAISSSFFLASCSGTHSVFAPKHNGCWCVHGASSSLNAARRNPTPHLVRLPIVLGQCSNLPLGQCSNLSLGSSSSTRAARRIVVAALAVIFLAGTAHAWTDGRAVRFTRGSGAWPRALSGLFASPPARRLRLFSNPTNLTSLFSLLLVDLLRYRWLVDQRTYPCLGVFLLRPPAVAAAGLWARRRVVPVAQGLATRRSLGLHRSGGVRSAFFSFAMLPSGLFASVCGAGTDAVDT